MENEMDRVTHQTRSHGWKRGAAAVLLAALAVTAAFALHSDARALAVQGDQESLALADQLSAAFEKVAESVSPSVVSVRAVKKVKVQTRSLNPFFNSPFRDLFDDFQFGVPNMPEEFSQEGLGSGFVLRDNGYILTNNHVVGGAEEVSVLFTDGKQLTARVIGSDPKTDVAVIKVDAEDLKPVRFSNSDKLRVGQWVVAVGSPFGLQSTITAGIISAKGRTRMGIVDYEDFIQTDCAINPGNSGGPLVNLHGEVIGVNTAIFTRTGGSMGIGFAIPINLARNIAEKLIKDGRVVRGYLGVYIQDLTGELAESFGFDAEKGVLISQVQDSGPADDAGIEEGDIVLQLDGEPIENATKLRAKVADMQPGTELLLLVWRDGKERKVTVEVGELPTEEARTSPQADDLDLGMELTTMTSELSQKLGYRKVIKGVLVTSVEPTGPAQRAGLQPRDIILRVQDEDVRSVEEFEQSLKSFDLKRGVRLVVQRGDARTFAILRTAH